MSNAQPSHSFAHNDNLLDQSIISHEVAPTIAAVQTSIETTKIVELADEQLEVVAGGAGQRRRPEVA